MLRTTTVPTSSAPPTTQRRPDARAPRVRTRERAPRRSSRVPAEELATLLDAIIETLGLQQTYGLYRHVAESSGVHATTVLRAHRGDLSTVRATVLEATRGLLERVQRGEPTALGGPDGTPPAAPASGRTGRVPVIEVRARIETLLASVCAEEQQYLYRHLAEKIGLHPTTVLRYHQGELHTAPAALLDAIDELEKHLARRDAVHFRRSAGGRPMVLRALTLELIEDLLLEGSHEHKGALFRELDEQLGARPGTISRIYYDRSATFVRADVHQALEQFVNGIEYDPYRIFRPGQRVRHHMFGLGTVQQKVHKNKILVKFAGRPALILCENVPLDPFLRLRLGQPNDTIAEA